MNSNSWAILKKEQQAHQDTKLKLARLRLIMPHIKTLEQVLVDTNPDQVPEDLASAIKELIASYKANFKESH